MSQSIELSINLLIYESLHLIHLLAIAAIVILSKNVSINHRLIYQSS